MLGFRWVAQTLVGAALIGDDQGEGARVGAVARQFYVENAVVDLDIAEVLVVLFLARGQLNGTQACVGRIAAKLEAMAVEVVPLGGDEAQLDRLRRGFHQAQLESFAHRQEIGAVVDRAQGRTGTTVQQAGSVYR
ncbi:hypothetical protein D3C84_949930 [compost metagenome]